MTIYDSNKLSNENYVVIDPNAPTSFLVEEVGPAYYNKTLATITNWWARSVNVNTNISNLTWHELGHIFYQGESQDKVIDFDNMIRLLHINTQIVPTIAPGYDKGASGYTKKVYQHSPMTPRPYDVTHNRLKL